MAEQEANINVSAKKSSLAEETKTQADIDKARAKWCDRIGNILVGLLLTAYIVYAFYFYATPSLNQKTTVGYSVANSLTFPTIFFQLTEYGTLEKVNISVYNESCKIQETSNPLKVTIQQVVAAETDKKPNIPTTTDWVILNTSIGFYNYSEFSNYTNSRRLLSSSPQTTDFYSDYPANFGAYYFENYTYKDYYTSAASNIYYIFPPSSPSEFNVNTNIPKQCGDVVLIRFYVSVPKNAFKSENATNPFKNSLYVRSYPDSFGIQYGYDSRESVLDSIEGKEFVYYSGRIAFGELKSEIVQLTSYDDKVDNKNEDFYEPIASIDYTNINYNLTTIATEKIIFQSYLYVYASSFVVQYQTVQQEGVLDVFSAIGGMQSTFAGPISFCIALWLYGMSLGFLVLKGRAAMNPMPEDFLKRLDVYLAEKVVSRELLAGPSWAADHPEYAIANANANDPGNSGGED